MSAPANDTSGERPDTPRSPRTGISGYWQMFREGCVTRNAPHRSHLCSFRHTHHRYDELVKAIIRPPRAEYDIEELGPASFDLAGVAFERDDFELQNGRALTLHCSMWRRQASPEGGAPCAAPPACLQALGAVRPPC